MSTALTVTINDDLRALILAQGGGNESLREGIAASFPIVSFRGKVWRVRYQGEAQPILMDGDPIPAILCVIVAANPKLSKMFFAGAYEEGSADAPTCFSLDGVKPDPTAEAPQCATCAACPHNVWGSKITPQGTKTKACSDSRRLAVVPYPDLDNEAYGGPMLLRVPPASFKELVRYSKHLDELGANFSAVVTRIGFDTEASFPKLVMREVRALSVAEFKKVIGMRDMETVERMLSASEAEIAEAAPDPGSTEPVEPKAAAPAKPKAAPKAAPAPEPEPEPQVEDAQEVADPVDDEIAKAMAQLKAAQEKKQAAAAPKAEAPKAEAKPKAAKATPAAAAGATGIEVPGELADLLKGFAV